MVEGERKIGGEREGEATGRGKRERVISGSSAPVKICKTRREKERETKETTRGRWLFKAGT